MTFTAHGESFRLAVLAERIRAAAQYDPQVAIGISHIDPLPHQVEAVYHYMLHLPRVRFLLADDPGAGKTIMAGLLLKELEQRGAIERVLVIVPANLTTQWQEELQTKFMMEFSILRSEQLKAHPGTSVWHRHPRAIVSIDFAKQDKIHETFEGMRWDMIIVDEAHRMAAYRYGQRTDKTQAYRLGEALHHRTDHLLLLTATPHRGNVDNFRLLLALLDPDMFQSNNTLPQILRQPHLPMFLRRMKEHMVDFDHCPLFPPRNVQTIYYELDDSESTLYDALTEYVSKRFQRADQQDDRTRRNVGLALAVLQRRMASSLRAIRISLDRRATKLRDQRDAMLRNPASTMSVPLLPHDDGDTDEERWNYEDEALGITFPATIHEMNLEIDEVQQLYALAQQAELEVERTGVERKLSELRKLMHDPLDNGHTIWESGEKLLVFTEHRDTLDYLVEKFVVWGFRVAKIYGGMNREMRQKAQQHFKDPHGAQILVATDAAGEGINLQFCRLMVNYDIPWNPNRLEQRMGRIHRYGQRCSVHIFNLVAANTREGRVLDVVLKKLEQMRHDLGHEHVYDIIGDLLSAADLVTLVQQAIIERQSLDTIQAAVASTLEHNEQQQRLQTALMRALVTDAFSPDAIAHLQQQARTSKEQRLVPKYIEHFVVAAFRAICQHHKQKANINPRVNMPGVWNIEVPHVIRLAAPKGHTIQPYYPYAIFQKSLRERYPDADVTLILLKHPLFEAIVTLVRSIYHNTLTTGARFAVPPAQQGLFWLFVMTVKDGTGAIVGQQLVGVHQRPTGDCTRLDPLILLDMEPIPMDPTHAPQYSPIPCRRSRPMSLVYKHGAKQILVTPILNNCDKNASTSPLFEKSMWSGRSATKNREFPNTFP